MKLLIFFLVSFAYANEEEGLQIAAKNMIQEEFKQIKISGHNKAPEAELEFKIPISWEAQEGDRPHVVQKYQPSKIKSGLQLIVIINSLPTQIKSMDTKEVLNIETLPELSKEMIPVGSELIDRQMVKIDGEPAGLIEYKFSTNRAGVEVGMHAINYFFIENGNLIAMQFSSGGSSVESASLKMKYFRSLFLKIAISIVIPSKWKRIDEKAQTLNQENRVRSEADNQPVDNDSGLLRIIAVNFAYWLPSVLMFFSIIYFSLRNRMNFPKGGVNMAILFFSIWSICSLIGAIFSTVKVSNSFGGFGTLVIPLLVSMFVLSISKSILRDR